MDYLVLLAYSMRMKDILCPHPLYDFGVLFLGPKEISSSLLYAKGRYDTNIPQVECSYLVPIACWSSSCSSKYDHGPYRGSPCCCWQWGGIQLHSVFGVLLQRREDIHHRAMVLKFQYYQNHLKGLLKLELLGPTQSCWFSWLGVGQGQGLRICILF